MENFTELLSESSSGAIAILDSTIPLAAYCPLDLSLDNKELAAYNVGHPIDCQKYIDEVLIRNNAQVAYGGYLEERALYDGNPNFTKKEGSPRTLHLGMDFWAPSGTKVQTPLEGIIHSFRNNNSLGDYGPTIILEHTLGRIRFYTLYGHLSLKSLEGLFVGRQFRKSSVLGTLGATEINVGYAPHLHFQLIIDIGHHNGDYPGVCTRDTLENFANNSPNPILLLNFS